MYLYEPLLGKEGKKGGREIKDSVYHLTQRQQFIDSFFGLAFAVSKYYL